MRLTARMLRLRYSRRAAVVVEFALVAPVFLLLVLAILGTGINGFYQLCLDDSLRNAARQVQLGGPASTGSGDFVAAVCQEFSLLASDCKTAISYDVQATSSAGNFASMTPVTPPASGTLPNAFPGSLGGNANVLLQVAYPLPFAIPYLANAITLSSGGGILSVATVRMEPAA